jgi:hypothetical protein
MPIVRSARMRVLVGACLMPLHAFAQAPDPAALAEALQMRDFVASFMHEQVAATCASRGFAQADRLSAAYAAWKAPLVQSIEQGEGALLRHYAEFGGSKETLRSEMTKRYRADTEPAVISDVTQACDASVRLLETGVPVPFSGRSGTDHRLRMDIYNQAQMASTCWQVDSIEASVVNFDPQGKSEERWVVAGCGKPVPVSVTYSPRAGGGTDFVVGVQGDALSQPERLQRLEAAKRLLEQAKARSSAP